MPSRIAYVKEKWTEVAVYLAQDAVYAKMAAQLETLNSGMLRLGVMALGLGRRRGFGFIVLQLLPRLGGRVTCETAVPVRT